MAFNGCYALLGYGFVDFENPADAQRAVMSLQSSGVLVQFAKVPQVSETERQRESETHTPAIRPLALVPLQWIHLDTCWF